MLAAYAESLQNLDSEEWRPVVEFPDLYEVSSLGRVRTRTRQAVCHRAESTFLTTIPGRLRKIQTQDYGYKNVAFCRNGKLYLRMVHCVVAAAFVGPKPDGMVVRHWNDITDDNRWENLIYGTVLDNAQDALENGRRNYGEQHHRCRISEATVAAVQQLRGQKSAEYIALAFGISESFIYKVWSGKRRLYG